MRVTPVRIAAGTGAGTGTVTVTGMVVVTATGAMVVVVTSTTRVGADDADVGVAGAPVVVVGLPPAGSGGRAPANPAVTGAAGEADVGCEDGNDSVIGAGRLDVTSASPAAEIVGDGLASVGGVPADWEVGGSTTASNRRGDPAG